MQFFGDHNMLVRLVPSPRFPVSLKTSLRIVWILACLALALTARCWNLRDVFLEGKIYFVDADCYSRMTRAQIIDRAPGTVLRHHDFENWPQDVTPHTTAPLDYLIVGLKRGLDASFAVLDRGHTSILQTQMLDLAGALISPLLGVAAALVLALGLWRLRVRFWEVAVFIFAVSPILVHGTLLGRPDHQALLILLLTVALCAELALVGHEEVPVNRNAWAVIAAAAWGLSVWVSLYEPLVLLAVVFGYWIVVARASLRSPERRRGLVVFAGIVVVSLLVEHWRLALPDAQMRQYFTAWRQTIGELAHVNPFSSVFASWMGLFAFAAPVLLFLAARRDRRAGLLLVLFLATVALTIWQARWGYFLALVFAFAVPWMMQALRRDRIAWAALIVSLWPIASDWDARLFPDEDAQRRQYVVRKEQIALRAIAELQRQRAAGPFLAPWWLSPAIAYWSEQPGVAGSSHESLPGIVDTARFFLLPTADDAAALLRERQVAWVLADAPDRLIPTSATLLGVAEPARCLAHELAAHPEEPVPESPLTPESAVPRSLGENFFQVWRVQWPPAPTTLPAP